MATTLNVIKEMKLNDTAGTSFDVSALSNMALKKVVLLNSDTQSAETTGGNNLIIGDNAAYETYGIKNTDIKARKAVRLWPGIDDESCSEIDLMADGALSAGVSITDIEQVHMKVLLSKENAKTQQNKVLRLKQTCSELELNNKNSTGVKNETQSQAGHFDIVIKHDNIFQDLNLKARSVDIRANANSNEGGEGGGVAIQTAACDSSFKENKVKVETSRIVDVFGGMPTQKSEVASYYNTWTTTKKSGSDGGTGIEIATLNSQFESVGTKEFRRLAQSDVFATTRSPIMTVYKATEDLSIPVTSGTITTKKFGCIVSATDSTSSYYADAIYADSMEATADSFLTGKTYSITKYDYGTALDDSKDIKSSSQANIKWIDLVNAAIYLKANKSIPSDGSFIPAVNVSFVLTNVTASSAATIALKSGNYEGTFTNASGYTLPGTITVTCGGTDITSEVTWSQTDGKVTIPAASITGDIVITITGTASS